MFTQAHTLTGAFKISVWVFDQVQGQDGWILAIRQVLFFCVFMDQDTVESHKLAKTEQERIYDIAFRETFHVGHGG